MSTHWTSKYVGKEYTKDYDCGHLTTEILQNEFGCIMPKEIENRDGCNNLFELTTLLLHNKKYLQPLEKESELKDGVVVLMSAKEGRLFHVGIFFKLGVRKYIIHNVKNIGQTICSNFEDIERMKLKIEGFYEYVYK